jgi:hypothetical protein
MFMVELLALEGGLWIESLGETGRIVRRMTAQMSWAVESK